MTFEKQKYQNFNSYNDLVEFFNNSSFSTIDLGLDRIKKALALLGNPQNSLKYIHIAGTNGKGSVLRYIETVLVETNFKTAAFTSPHLVDYTERIRVGNKKISKNDFLYYSNKLLNLLNVNEEINLTLFELLTIIAIMYFYDQNVDLVLLEVGLGGRLDATNVIDKPLMSIITSIDIDHTDYLGETIEAIALEKAAIIKPNSNIVFSDTNKAFDLLQSVANNNNCKIYISETNRLKSKIDKINVKQKLFDKKGDYLFNLSMLGAHQIENVGLALKAFDILNLLGYKITKKKIKTAIEKTYWPGRAQFIKKMNVFLDGAHNPSGASKLRELIDTYFSNKRIIWIIGILKSKDASGMIENLITNDDTVIFTELESCKSYSSQELKSILENMNIHASVLITNNINKAMETANSIKMDNSLIVIAGSLYLVGDFFSLISKYAGLVKTNL